MKRHGLKALVEWAVNVEADEFANGDTHRFDPALDVKIKQDDFGWYILPMALEIGRLAEWRIIEAQMRQPRFQAEEGNNGEGSTKNDCERRTGGELFCMAERQTKDRSI